MNQNILLAITTSIVSLLFATTSVHANEGVHVELRSTSLAVSDAELSIGDVCEIRGGSVQLRKRISALDLDSIAPGEIIVVSNQQVAVRIALAGITRNDVDVSGPDEIKVRLISNESLKQRFEAMIESELSSQFGIPQDDVRVRLLDLPILSLLRESLDTTNFKVAAYFSGQLPLGDSRIQLEISDAKRSAAGSEGPRSDRGFAKHFRDITGSFQRDCNYGQSCSEHQTSIDGQPSRIGGSGLCWLYCGS